MDLTLTYTVNSIFGWLLTIISVFGYFLTLKRVKEKWMFWIVLATGWALFAMAQTFLISGQFNNLPFLLALGLSSWILVIVSLLLGFLKVVRLSRKS